MTDSELKDKIRGKVKDLARARGVKVDAIPNDAQLIDAGYLDSASVIELVVWIEGLFDTELEFDQLTRENFGSIDQIVDFMTTRDTR